MKERIAWIDGLKFFACLAIVWGHVFGIFYPQTLASPVRQAVKALGALEMSCFWVPVFCLVSGRLVRYHAGTGLLHALAHRYLRFAVPFAISGFLIWAWLQAFPAETQAYGARLGNSWLATMYAVPLRLADVAAMTIVFDATIDPPLWMLRDLFFGNAWVIFAGWMGERHAGGAARALVMLGVAGGLAAGVPGIVWPGRMGSIAPHGILFAATVLGCAMPSIEQWLEDWLGRKYSACLVLAAIWLSLTLLSFARGRVPDAALWCIGLALAVLALAVLPAARPVCRDLARLAPCGALSLPLYLLHAPMLVTVMLASYGAAEPAVGHTCAVLAAGAIGTASSLAAAAAWAWMSKRNFLAIFRHLW